LGFGISSITVTAANSVGFAIAKRDSRKMLARSLLIACLAC
jgi:hypothetical protein